MRSISWIKRRPPYHLSVLSHCSPLTQWDSESDPCVFRSESCCSRLRYAEYSLCSSAIRSPDALVSDTQHGKVILKSNRVVVLGVVGAI
jgi:hypothetical protein